MRIEISEFIEEPVPGELVGFARHVGESEPILEDWTLVIWGCKGEGECASDLRIIMMGLCSTLEHTKMLFLHEVAHGIVEDGLYENDWKDPRWQNSYWHLEPWQDAFHTLLERYMPGTTPPPWLIDPCFEGDIDE